MVPYPGFTWSTRIPSFSFNCFLIFSFLLNNRLKIFLNALKSYRYAMSHAWSGLSPLSGWNLTFTDFWSFIWNSNVLRFFISSSISCFSARISSFDSFLLDLEFLAAGHKFRIQTFCRHVQVVTCFSFVAAKYSMMGTICNSLTLRRSWASCIDGQRDYIQQIVRVLPLVSLEIP